MPTLNRSVPGVYAAGTAAEGGAVIITGSAARPPVQRTVLGPDAGQGGWYDASRLIGTYHHVTAPFLALIDAATGATVRLTDDRINSCCAGGSHWAAFTIERGTVYNGIVLGAEHLVTPFPVRFGPDGWLLYHRLNADGLLRSRPGEVPNADRDDELEPAHVRVIDAQAFDGGGVLWRTGQGRSLRWVDLDFPENYQLVAGDIHWLVGIRRHDGWWLAYQSGLRVVLHPATELRGYEWSTPASFNLDADNTAWGARVAWSTVAGEPPGAIVCRDVTFTEPRVPLLPPGGTEPPVIPPVEPPVSTDYLAINKQVRALYPRANPGGHPLGSDHCWYLVDLAQRTGTLLFEKNDSNSVLIPQVNKRVSLDIVGRGTMGNTYADCLKDSEGVADPVWDVKSPADGVYIDVRGVVIPPSTGPVDPPVQPPGTLPPGVYPITYPPGYVPPKDLSDWIDHEFPVLVQAHIKTQGFAPDYTWAAFQTCRRYGAGLPQGEPAWTFEQMLRHELGQS